jgi:PIN like domain
LAQALEKEGIVVRVHDQHFKPNEADETWLGSCGQKSWVAIRPDKRILSDPRSMRAIGANKGRVLFLPHNNKNPVMWASIILENWAEITRVLRSRRPPFVARLSPNGIWDVRELNKLGRDRKGRKKT